MTLGAVQPSKFCFVTLDQYRASVDINGQSDTTLDPYRQMALNAACAEVEKECRRPIVARTLTELYDGTEPSQGLSRAMFSGKRKIFLKPAIILPVTNPGGSITVTETTLLSSAPTTLVLNTDFLAYDDEGYLERTNNGMPWRWATGHQNITVSYTSGLCSQVWSGGSYGNGTFTGVTPTTSRFSGDYDPSGLILATCALAKMWEKSGPADYGTQMGDGVYVKPSDIPPQVKRMIAPWVNRSL